MTELVKKAAKRPNVTFEIVFFPGPDFRSGIVRSSSLGCCELSFHDFGDVEISMFGDTVDDKNVGSFDVSVDNFVFVHDFHTLEQIMGDFPEEFFFEPAVFKDFLFEDSLKGNWNDLRQDRLHWRTP